VKAFLERNQMDLSVLRNFTDNELFDFFTFLFRSFDLYKCSTRDVLLSNVNNEYILSITVEDNDSVNTSNSIVECPSTDIRSYSLNTGDRNNHLFTNSITSAFSDIDIVITRKISSSMELEMELIRSGADIGVIKVIINYLSDANRIDLDSFVSEKKRQLIFNRALEDLMAELVKMPCFPDLKPLFFEVLWIYITNTYNTFKNKSLSYFHHNTYKKMVTVHYLRTHKDRLFLFEDNPYTDKLINVYWFLFSYLVLDKVGKDMFIYSSLMRDIEFVFSQAHYRLINTLLEAIVLTDDYPSFETFLRISYTNNSSIALRVVFSTYISMLKDKYNRNNLFNLSVGKHSSKQLEDMFSELMALYTQGQCSNRYYLKLFIRRYSAFFSTFLEFNQNYYENFKKLHPLLKECLKNGRYREDIIFDLSTADIFDLPKKETIDKITDDFLYITIEEVLSETDGVVELELKFYRHYLRNLYSYFPQVLYYFIKEMKGNKMVLLNLLHSLFHGGFVLELFIKDEYVPLILHMRFKKIIDILFNIINIRKKEEHSDFLITYYRYHIIRCLFSSTAKQKTHILNSHNHQDLYEYAENLMTTMYTEYNDSNALYQRIMRLSRTVDLSMYEVSFEQLSTIVQHSILLRDHGTIVIYLDSPDKKIYSLLFYILEGWRR